MENGSENYRRYREAGDMQAFAALITEYRDGLIGYLGSITGDLSLAEELAEDTFVRLGVKRPRDKGTGSFKTWLYTIGRNVTIDALRRRARHPELPLSEEESAAATETIEEIFCRDERKRQLHRAMQKLKTGDRQLLWLYYFEGFSLREAADVLHKSTHAAETQMVRARAALKAQLLKEGFVNEEL